MGFVKLAGLDKTLESTARESQVPRAECVFHLGDPPLSRCDRGVWKYNEHGVQVCVWDSPQLLLDADSIYENHIERFSEVSKQKIYSRYSHPRTAPFY